MRLPRSLPLPLALALAVGSVGCSASTFEYTPCDANAQCRSTFGHGSVCEAGFCSEVGLDPRCELGTDADLALPLDPEAHVVFGTIFNRTTASHLARQRSAHLAIEQVNSRGALDGRTFVLVQCSNEPDTGDGLDLDEATVAMARHLADEIGVAAIVGPSASGRTQSAFTEVEPLGTLLISPSATSPALTALDGTTATEVDPGLLWRTAPPDTVQGPVIANSLIDRGIEKVAAIHAADAYGEGLAEVVAEAFTGGARAVELLPFSDEAGLVDQAANAVADSVTEEVLFISSDLDEVVAFLDAAAALPGFVGVDIFLTDSARSQDLLDRAGPSIGQLEMIRGTSPALPTGVVYDAFRASYTVAWGEDVSERSFTAHTYDAAMLVAYGAAWSTLQEGRLDGLGISRGLRRVSDGVPIDIRASEWDSVRSAFAEAISVDVRGASGELDFDTVTGETTGPIELWRVADDGNSFEVIAR